MFETLQEKTEEKAMVQFLERFTDYPFLVKFKNSEYHIGEGEPTFTVNFKKAIPLADLMKSTSLALGDALIGALVSEPWHAAHVAEAFHGVCRRRGSVPSRYAL